MILLECWNCKRTVFGFETFWWLYNTCKNVEVISNVRLENGYDNPIQILFPNSYIDLRLGQKRVTDKGPWNWYSICQN